MNTSLQPFQGVRDETAAQLDYFFTAKPCVNHWDLVISHLPASSDLIPLIQALEPLKPGDLNKHTAWTLQQELRLALRKEAGLPLTDNKVCTGCGVRPADPVLWGDKCLWCQERAHQLPDTGGRGSCRFMSPAYDPHTHTWGLLYYNSFDYESVFLIWAVLGFGSADEARLSLYPASCYEEWLCQKYGGVYSSGAYGALFDLLPLTKWIQLKNELPLGPASFTSLLKEAIRLDMGQDHDLLEYTLSTALREYERNQDE